MPPQDEVPEALAERDSLEETALGALNAESVRNALAQLPSEQRS
ncbi:MAG TPA: hypothetical protein VGG51_11855 [Candidatus Cybelea sp.]